MSAQPLRILLSEAASAALLAAGDAFMVAGRGSYPETDGKRVVIDVVPVDKRLADQAGGVVLGTPRAVKLRESKEAGESSTRARDLDLGLLAGSKKGGGPTE